MSAKLSKGLLDRYFRSQGSIFSMLIFLGLGTTNSFGSIFSMLIFLGLGTTSS